MAFTAADVKKLREMTNVGMMDCKKALTASDGDMDKAVEWLREKGLAAAAKKSGRIAAEGAVCAVVENGVGAIVEVNCETDFAAQSDKFTDFVKDSVPPAPAFRRRMALLESYSRRAEASSAYSPGFP